MKIKIFSLTCERCKETLIIETSQPYVQAYSERTFKTIERGFKRPHNVRDSVKVWKNPKITFLKPDNKR